MHIKYKSIFPVSAWATADFCDSLKRNSMGKRLGFLWDEKKKSK